MSLSSGLKSIWSPKKCKTSPVLVLVCSFLHYFWQIMWTRVCSVFFWQSLCVNLFWMSHFYTISPLRFYFYPLLKGHFSHTAFHTVWDIVIISPPLFIPIHIPKYRLCTGTGNSVSLCPLFGMETLPSFWNPYGGSCTDGHLALAISFHLSMSIPPAWHTHAHTHTVEQWRRQCCI